MFMLKRTPVTPRESTAVSAQSSTEQEKVLMGWRNIFSFGGHDHFAVATKAAMLRAMTLE